MIFFVFILVLSIYGLSNYLIARCTFKWLKIMFLTLPAIPFYIAYSLIALSVIFMFLIPSNFFVHKSITIISYYWMGIYFYSLIFILIAILIIFLLLKFNIILNNTTTILIAGWIILVLLLTTIIYGKINASNIKYKNYNITINKNTKIDRLKSVLISDLHLGYINNKKHIEKVVEKINKIKPDVVFIAGDIFDNSFDLIEDPDEILKLFNSIESKYGVYVSFGNHDAGNSYNKMVDYIESSNMKLLLDEAIVIEDTFVVIGRRDSNPIGDNGDTRELEFILKDEYLELPIIVLDHQPSNINEYDDKFDLILGGHTHKGQIFPANFITKNLFTVDYGYYKKDNKSPQVIVTSGAGTWGPPFRIGSNNEIAIINMEFKHE